MSAFGPSGINHIATMKRSALVVAALTVIAIAVVGSRLLWPDPRPPAPGVDPSKLVLDAPTWLQQIPLQRADVRVEEPPTSAPVAIARETGLAQAIAKAKVPINYSVSSLADSGLAQDIVDGLGKSVERLAVEYEHQVSEDKQTGTRYLNEFFFALWPDMGQMIASGKMKPRITRIPDGAKSLPNSLWVVRKPENASEIILNTANGWQVVFGFTETANPLPELYARAINTP